MNVSKKQTKNNTFENSWFNPGPRLKVVLWYFFNALFMLNPLQPSSSIKVSVLKLFGAKIGKGVLIKPKVNIKYPWKLIVGDFVWIGEDVWIDNLEKVIIGNNVCLSQGSLILTGNHNYKKSTFDLITGAITLEDGVWVGAKSIVCPGVTCMSHSILTVGSVATSDLEPYSIYQGNPAKFVRIRKITS